MIYKCDKPNTPYIDICKDNLDFFKLIHKYIIIKIMFLIYIKIL